MAAIGEILFFDRAGPDLGEVLRYQASQGLSQAVDAIPEELFANSTDEVLAQRAAERANVHPLTVEFDKAEPRVAATTVTVSDFGQMRRVKGYRVTKTIPFHGDPHIWKLRPNRWDSNPPRGEVGQSHLIIGIDVQDAQAERAADAIDRIIESVRCYLGWQSAQIQDHNSTLTSQALPLIERRRAYLQRGAALLDSLKKR